MPIDTTPTEFAQIVRNHKQVLEVTGLVPIATIILFSKLVFIYGASPSNDRAVRQSALLDIMYALDLGVEMGAEMRPAND